MAKFCGNCGEKLKASGNVCQKCGKQKITHIQEEPEYKKEYLLEAGTIFIGKIFAIDDGDHSTMLLAEEY